MHTLVLLLRFFLLSTIFDKDYSRAHDIYHMIYIWRKFAIIDFVHKFDVAIATFKNLLKMAVLKERLNKTYMEKVG